MENILQILVLPSFPDSDSSSSSKILLETSLLLGRTRTRYHIEPLWFFIFTKHAMDLFEIFNCIQGGEKESGDENSRSIFRKAEQKA